MNSVVTKRLGDAWAKQSRSAVLQLPSVIIPGESNYLLNTSHPDFKSITIGKAEAFSPCTTCGEASGERNAGTYEMDPATGF